MTLEIKCRLMITDVTAGQIANVMDFAKRPTKNHENLFG